MAIICSIHISLFLFIGYSAVSLDGDIFLLPQNIVSSYNIFASPPRTDFPFQHRVSGELQAYERRKSSASAFMLRGVSGNA